LRTPNVEEQREHEEMKKGGEISALFEKSFDDLTMNGGGEA
jgi:hypothetical protein